MPKRAKQKKRAILPPMGPPTNLRPGGVHEDKGRKTRADLKRAALEEQSAALDLSDPVARGYSESA
jgi:hypothetical protein